MEFDLFVHMPAFMAISGYFAYKESDNSIQCKDMIKRRALQLLVPYFIWSVLSFLVKGDYSFSQLVKIVLAPDSFFWFLWALFWISTLFVLAKYLAKAVNVDEIITILSLDLLLMGIMVAVDVRVCGFQFIAYYSSFYTLGYCIRRYNVFHNINKWIIFLFAIVWLLFAWSWHMHDLPTWMPLISGIPSSITQYAYRGVTAFLAVAVLLNVSPMLLESTNKLNSSLARIGSVSLGVYVVHLLFMPYIVKIMHNIAPNLPDALICMISFIAGLVLSVFITELLMKTKITSRYLLGKI